MSMLFTMALSLAALALFTLVLIVLMECLLGVLPLREDRRTDSSSRDARAVVLVPAHDEEAGIAATVAGLGEQLGPSDRLLVIADNCTDSTAAIAREAGAEVIERVDPEHRGKGYAISFGVEHLLNEPPDVLVVVDADCRLLEGALRSLVETAQTTGRPVQAEYLFAAPNDSTVAVVSALATMIRNQVRPRGLHRLGFPCQLTGSGMAFPWEAMVACPPMHSHLVEDLMMGIELAVLGYPPVYCPQAEVRSGLPEHEDAAMTQRTRWEHGQLMTQLDQVPRLMSQAFSQQNAGLFALALDLLVPPLALLVLLHGALGVVAFAFGVVGGSWAPTGLVFGSLFWLGVAVLAGWARFGRAEIPFRTILKIPFYILWKLPIYVSFFLGRRQTQWQRTKR